jgi:hypothetical protein
MGAPLPQFIPEAFAISAAPGDRNTIPATPLTTQRASFELGFPPLTMLPVIAGGKPMLGPDMNGILYMISTHQVYAQSGKLYPYSADVAVAIGGYEVGTLLGSTDGLTVWYNLSAGNLDDPNDPASTGWVPLYSYGLTPVNTLTGATRTLTPQEAARSILVLSGALVGNQQIVLPNNVQSWLIVNNTTGAFVTTVRTAGGVGVVVPQGGFASPTAVYGNGTDIFLTFAPAALPIDVSPTANTIAKRDNLGYLYAATIAGATDNTTRVATTAFVQAVSANTIAATLLLMLGSVIQTWSNPARGAFTTYVNSTGRPIMVNVSCNSVGFAVARVGGVDVMYRASDDGADIIALSFIVPAGQTYRVDVSGGAGIVLWAELS